MSLLIRFREIAKFLRTKFKISLIPPAPTTRHSIQRFALFILLKPNILKTIEDRGWVPMGHQ